MSILSIQSHVAYGYVGNKAATYPLQSMGYDVWPVNTVQFSNHTGYDKWKGDIFSAQHLVDVIGGIETLGGIRKCQGILSGYMGSLEICEVVRDTVARFKKINPEIVYLCDPVMGGNTCHVKHEVVEFFCDELNADIITPNQFEAEMLSGIKIISENNLKAVADYLHTIDIKIVVITGVRLQRDLDEAAGFFTLVSEIDEKYLIKNNIRYNIQINGTGDLFSAVYLGSYLKHRNPLLAAQHAVFYTEQAVNHTISGDNIELQVIKPDYKLSRVDTLPQYIAI